MIHGKGFAFEKKTKYEHFFIIKGYVFVICMRKCPFLWITLRVINFLAALYFMCLDHQIYKKCLYEKINAFEETTHIINSILNENSRSKWAPIVSLGFHNNLECNHLMLDSLLLYIICLEEKVFSCFSISYWTVL